MSTQHERPADTVDRLPARMLMAVFGAVAATLAAVALVDLASDRSVGFLTRDPAYAVSLEGCERAACAYAGVLSQIGVLVMAGTTVVALLGAVAAPPDSPRRRLLFGATALSAIVLIDDAFMLHDGLLAYAHDAGEKATLLAVGCCAAAFVVAFRGQIARLRPALLIVCAICFGASLLVDQALSDPPRLLEDGAKFVGLVSWSLWVTLAALPLLVRAPAAAAPR